MNIKWKTMLLITAGAAIAGCSQSSYSRQEVSLTQPPSEAIQAPSAAEQACLAAVSNQTNISDVVALSSEFSEAGTIVRVGVGPQRAPWNCIAYSDGSTAEIRSLTNEGAL